MAYQPRATAQAADKMTTTVQIGSIMGVDFRSDDCATYRTPDSVNMHRSPSGYWETHAGYRVIGKFRYTDIPESEENHYAPDDTAKTTPLRYYVPQIYNLYKFRYVDKRGIENTHVIVHAGNWLWRWNNYPDAFTQDVRYNDNGVSKLQIERINHGTFDDKTQKYTGQRPLMREKSKMIQFGNNLLILDSNYFYRYFYDEETDSVLFREVTNNAFTPLLFTAKKANGSDGDAYQDRNMLQPKFQEQFEGDAQSTVFKLSVPNCDKSAADDGTLEYVRAWYVDDDGAEHELTVANSFTNSLKTTVRLATAPPKPNITGTGNVYIETKKTTDGYREAITRCTEMLVFDGRLFLTGNPKYPNTVFWSGKDDFTYFSEVNLSDAAGKGGENIKALQLLNDNSFLTIKESTAQDGSYAVWQPTTLTINNRALDTYKCSQSNSTVGTYKATSHCVFMDDNVFIGNNGLNAVSRALSISNERNVEHRSTLIDNKLLNEDLTNIILEQHGTKLYMLCTQTGHVYIADSLMKNSDVSTYQEYEWAYLENIGYKGYDGVFNPAEMIRSLGDKELYIGARSQTYFHLPQDCTGHGVLMKFNFDMVKDEDTTELRPEAYSFEREIDRYDYATNKNVIVDGFEEDDKYEHIKDYVDTPFSWFNYSNHYKKLIRKYNDLYIEAMSKSNILIAFRTENMFLSGSKVINLKSQAVSEEKLLAAFTDEVKIVNGIFDFSALELDDEFTFETLNKVSYALRKLKAKKFRRLQIRLKSAKKNRPFGFKAMILDAEILAKKIK